VAQEYKNLWSRKCRIVSELVKTYINVLQSRWSLASLLHLDFSPQFGKNAKEQSGINWVNLKGFELLQELPNPTKYMRNFSL
jgi:hypothetical protein